MLPDVPFPTISKSLAADDDIFHIPETCWYAASAIVPYPSTCAPGALIEAVVNRPSACAALPIASVFCPSACE